MAKKAGKGTTKILEIGNKGFDARPGHLTRPRGRCRGRSVGGTSLADALVALAILAVMLPSLALVTMRLRSPVGALEIEERSLEFAEARLLGPKASATEKPPGFEAVGRQVSPRGTVYTLSPRRAQGPGFTWVFHPALSP